MYLASLATTFVVDISRSLDINNSCIKREVNINFKTIIIVFVIMRGEATCTVFSTFSFQHPGVLLCFDSFLD